MAICTLHLNPNIPYQIYTQHYPIFHPSPTTRIQDMDEPPFSYLHTDDKGRCGAGLSARLRRDRTAALLSRLESSACLICDPRLDPGKERMGTNRNGRCGEKRDQSVITVECQSNPIQSGGKLPEAPLPRCHPQFLVYPLLYNPLGGEIDIVAIVLCDDHAAS